MSQEIRVQSEASFSFKKRQFAQHKKKGKQDKEEEETRKRTTSKTEGICKELKSRDTEEEKESRELEQKRGKSRRKPTEKEAEDTRA